MMVAADLMRRGHKIAFPYGEDSMLSLRLRDTRNNQRIGVRFASDYVDF